MKILEKKYIHPLYKIKEFAEFVGLTVDTLLFYEKIGLFLPHEKNEETGYRYYSISQLGTISQIIQLKNLQLSLEEIKQFLQGNFTMNQKLKMVQEKIFNLQSLVQIFKIFNKEMSYSAYIKEIPEHIVYTYKTKVAKSIDILFIYEKILNEFIQKKVKIKQPYNFYTKYYDDKIKFEDNNVEIFAEVLNANVNTKIIPKQKYICTLHNGDYHDLPKAYKFLNEYCKKANIETIDYPIEQYIESYGSKDSANDFVTEIMLQIK
ncbi:MAG: MerR family transcriptional regulator [Clostridia bacterium]